MLRNGEIHQPSVFKFHPHRPLVHMLYKIGAVTVNETITWRLLLLIFHVTYFYCISQIIRRSSIGKSPLFSIYQQSQDGDVQKLVTSFTTQYQL